MPPTSEGAMGRIAQAVVGPSVSAHAAFGTVAELTLRGGGSGALVALVQWVVAKHRSSLPAYPYLALTPEDLVVLEFRFGATTELRRTVGWWPLSSIIVVEAAPELWRARLVLPPNRNPVELEGAFRTDAERHVIERLQELLAG